VPATRAPPFVAVGDAVTADTVVGIVETMKLMNPVHAGRAGSVAAVLAANGALVAKGAPLVRLS
jgi:acetyl-CoA carboxylase biotin carboxyl carrier protein